MAITNDINQVQVGVYDKVREYYRIDKKLGGLIKTFVSVRIETISRTISIYVPFLEKRDEIQINGYTYIPKPSEKGKS